MVLALLAVEQLPFTDTESPKMTRPFIQIGDETREMTDEEYEVYVEQQSNCGASADIVD